jgi:hypothetical protein
MVINSIKQEAADSINNVLNKAFDQFVAMRDFNEKKKDDLVKSSRGLPGQQPPSLFGAQ